MTLIIRILLVPLMVLGLSAAPDQSARAAEDAEAGKSPLTEGIEAYEAGDYVGAFKAWLPLAYDDDAVAQRNLAHLYRKGLGVTQNLEKAAEWYRRAADLGLARAQGNLGNLYLRGHGVEKDFEEAAAWFRRAAEQGHAISQYNLGVMNKNGFGVAQDVAEAAQWMRRAARQGNAGAQYILGAMYSTGQGVDEDPVRAHMWLDLAARSGDERAGATLDRLAKSMTREQVGEARQRVGEWKPNTE